MQMRRKLPAATVLAKDMKPFSHWAAPPAYTVIPCFTVKQNTHMGIVSFFIENYKFNQIVTHSMTTIHQP